PVVTAPGIAFANSQGSVIRGDPPILFAITPMTARFFYASMKMRGWVSSRTAGCGVRPDGHNTRYGSAADVP
ncbi:MAG TPA: hypothetical protein VKI44_08725, partial [Acetobacteraceae bacterium]|nr:hypothetical protein [Acetobacteraceae bacterium]